MPDALSDIFGRHLRTGFAPGIPAFLVMVIAFRLMVSIWQRCNDKVMIAIRLAWVLRLPFDHAISEPCQTCVYPRRLAFDLHERE
ncbi:hypothetical protein SAMN05216414_10918 [Nitrosovibrio sp. Nv17]|nr:hypothetical protein SAMN05216414_10918 [Nitrosovibrio sp. Nv17]